MECAPTSLPGVVVLQPRIFPDPRGFFFESYNERVLAGFGITARFVQDNHSRSRQGTLRGLHYQLKHPQAKLCRVIRGRVLDIAVDIRCGSPYFGQWFGVELSEENKKQVFVPRGFAHGFMVLSEEAEFLYKCDDFYVPEDEHGVAWNCPQLNVDWRLAELGGAEPLLSAKDGALAPLYQVAPDLLPRYENK